MKILIIGLGSVGQRHLQNLRSIYKKKINIEILRQRGFDKVIREKKILKNKIIRKYYNLKENLSFFEATKKKPDLVIISNPSSMHEKFIMMSLKKKLNFFVEKPALTSAKKIKPIVKMINKHNVISMVGFQSRFNPLLIKVKKIIEGKSLGKIINADFKWHTFLPDFHRYENYKKSYAARKKLGGGVVFSLIHEIDVIQWFFGMPKTTYAIKNFHKKINIESEENVHCLMKFKNKNNYFDIFLNLSFTEKKNIRKFKIIFEHGTLYCNLEKNFFEIYKLNKLVKKIKIKIKRNDLFKNEIKHLIKAIKRNVKTEISFEEGAKSVVIAEKIIDSFNKSKELNI